MIDVWRITTNFCYTANMSGMSEVDHLAKAVWDYHLLHHSLRRCDSIFVLCSIDSRVAERAAQLYLNGLGEYLIFSGGFSDLTKDMFQGSEADHFASIARQMGVPGDKIIIEGRNGKQRQLLISGLSK